MLLFPRALLDRAHSLPPPLANAPDELKGEEAVVRSPMGAASRAALPYVVLAAPVTP